MYVELGKLVGVWGVKGWVKLHSYTRNRADISQYKTWYLQKPGSKGDPTPIAVLNCREQGQGMVVQFDDVNDRDQAMAMSGQMIFVKQSDLPKLPKGEFYWQQLIGLTVKNETVTIGKVSSILETGANDVLVCKNVKEGKADVLIPYNNDVVLDIELEAGTILVEWDPDFLLED
ncbi:MAG: 16S rRNA processing protein RimM [Arenicella sp.]